MNQKIYSVSQVNNFIKSILDRSDVLQNIFISGEISNYKCYPSGHHYFSLKDQESSIRCVMFRTDAIKLRFRPENGMKIIAFGRISSYPRDGQYQFYCNAMKPDGAGDLAIAFEQLKRKLEAKGYFNPDAKKEIPVYPKKIALITSQAGAAVHDMIRILNARFPLTNIMVVPVKVQGEGSAEEISTAIDLVNVLKCADLIITGRGGGSVEDLWAFNEETVADAIYRSEIPIISAVGHEPDVTISDFVADKRASTPSNAAEIAVPSKVDVIYSIGQTYEKLKQIMDSRLSSEQARINKLNHDLNRSSPINKIQDKQLQVDNISQRLKSSMEKILMQNKMLVTELAASMDALSPFKVLKRGYSYVQDSNGTVITRYDQVKIGDNLKIRLSDGKITCTVTESEEI